MTPWAPNPVSDDELNAFRHRAKRPENVLVIGMMQFASPTGHRDMLRISVLKTLFTNLYSLAPSAGFKNLHALHPHHIDGAVGRRSADNTYETFVEQNSKLDYILLDYVHMTKTYYCDNLLVGSPQANKIESTAGSNLISYIEGLKNRGLLNPGCKLILATVRSADGDIDLPRAAIKNLEDALSRGRQIRVGWWLG